MYLRAFIGDNEWTLELTNIRHIQAEVSLQGQIDLYALGDVNKGSARPDSTIERSKFVILNGYNCRKVFAEDLGVLLEAILDAQKNDALLFECFLNVMVDHFRVVLSAYAS